MKFDCGLTKLDKMKRKVMIYKSWRTKFAWFPVQVDNNDCRWLELVEYRYPEAWCNNFGTYFSKGDIEYRAHILNKN